MKLKLVSLNAWGYHGWPERKKRLVAFLRQCDADVVLLQEVNDDERYNVKGGNSAALLNEELGYEHVLVCWNSYVDGTVKPELGSGHWRQGLAMLSKYPLKEVVHHWLAQEADDKFRRGVLLATVDMGASWCDVLNVHFSNRAAWAEKHWNETRELLRECNRRPVILGDCNMFKKDLVGLQLPKGYVSMYERTQYTSYLKDDEAYDQCLVPEELWVRSFEVMKEDVSDHQALLITITTEEE